MSKFATTITAASSLSVAALITFSGVWFAPKPLTPVAAGPTTPVPVELRQAEPGKILDGEVTTTVFAVSGQGISAKVGKELLKSDDPAFIANLANGQYLIKSVPSAASKLTNFDDIDNAAVVPPAAGCGDRLGCTWIWVNNVQQHNAWGIMSSPSASHDKAEFTFSRSTVSTSGVPLPPQAAPTPTTAPVVRANTAHPRATTKTPRTTPTGPIQYVDVVVTELLNGSDIAVQNVQVALVYLDGRTGAPFALAGATDQTGTSDFTTPVARFVVSVVPPAGYRVVSHSAPGLNEAVGADEGISVSIGLERVPAPDPASQPPVEAPANEVATPSTPVTSVSDADGSASTTVPASTTTAPAPTTTTTTPATTTTLPDEPVPSTPPPTTIDQGQIGCDETNDPELTALLQFDDGVMRWLVNGELRTAVAEEGSNPVIVCEAAYQRLLDMGFDSAYISLG